jgi:rod shape-determining protein MreC
MSQLFGLLNRAKYFFLFIFLEFISFALIRKNNLQWDVNFFNTTNAAAAKTLVITSKAKEYINLKEENENLAIENSVLRKELTIFREKGGRQKGYYITDSLFAGRFNFKVAKVINSTTARAKNYITINQGKLDGIVPGMGVIGPKGIVGQVMSCSDHFSRVYSILHEEFKVSSEVKNKKLRKLNQTALGLSTWDGRSHRLVKLNTIDKFKPVTKGDSVFSSAQNLIFPANILIGTIYQVTTPLNGAFHDIDVKLATDFGGLTFVYVIGNKLVGEQIKLETEDKFDE